MLLCAISICGCQGYKLGSLDLYRPDIRTVYIPMIQSDSYRKGLGEQLTEAVVKEIEAKTPPLQPIPERDYTTEDRTDRQADSLINRLKYFQENLDTRFLHDEKREIPSVPKTFDFSEENRFVEQQSFATRKAPLDNKKYMEVLESFIFLKDQNKHR